MFVQDRDLLICELVRDERPVPSEVRDADRFGDPDLLAIRVIVESHNGEDEMASVLRLAAGLEMHPSHNLLNLLFAAAMTSVQENSGLFAQVIASYADDDLKADVLRRHAMMSTLV